MLLISLSSLSNWFSSKIHGILICTFVKSLIILAAYGKAFQQPFLK